MTITINPFLAGVVATVIVEFVILTIVAVVKGGKNSNGKSE